MVNLAHTIIALDSTDEVVNPGTHDTSHSSRVCWKYGGANLSMMESYRTCGSTI